MVGQGGPKASRAPSARTVWAMPWLCRAALLALCLACLPASQILAADAVLQLRIAWGGGAERIWQGSIRLSAGRFSGLQPLGIEADEPGSIWLAEQGIEIQQRSLRAYDGVDVLVTADLDARLVIALASESGEAAQPTEIPLRTLVSQSHNNSLDDTGNRLLVSRSPSDRLRITFDRDHLVFVPGEMFSFQLQQDLLDVSVPELRFQAQITSNPGGQRIWSEEYAAGDEGTATSVTLKVPDEEGVYDLTIAAAQSSRFRRLRPHEPVAERKIQFVVLHQRPQLETGQGPPSRVVEINPVNPRWWERFGNLPLIPGLRKGPLGNGDAATWEHPQLGPMIQLGPGGAAPNISWEAYPLPINNPGQVHILEIEYPSDVPQAMGISLLEPNAAGAVTPIGLDSGVYVSDEEAESPPRMARHRVIFWPRTKTPLLLITNRRPGSRAVYGKIAVLSGTHSKFSALSLKRPDVGNLLPPAFADSRRPERLWAGYMDRPLFPENFSAPEALDASSHRSLDDWNTFYQGGIRLVKYLKHVGYGGLMMSAFADGSTIYPSQIVEPTPRYDTGVFFATGQDPQRKDVLELLFRLFDREGLMLMPALQFASPLPELEAIKRAGGPQAVGIEWIGADGKPWLSGVTPRQGLAPYYNLLDPRVQEAMLRVAGELTARYATHDSFGGLALQLSPDGYAQLPGEDWGYDDQTISRFESDTKTRVPGTGAQRFAARARYLSGPGRTAWLEWRANVVADFHRRLQNDVGSRHEGAKLYLAGGTMLENRQTQFRLRPTLPRRTKLDEALLELGIHAQSYRDPDGAVLLRPQHLRPSLGAQPAQAADAEIYLAPEMDKLFSNQPEPAHLFYHEPQKARLVSFDAKSPFGAANTYTWLVSQMSPSNDRNRRRFAHSLAISDTQEVFDGGWLLPLGQEDALKDLVSVYRLLPGEHFETVAGEFQPVTMRTLNHDRQTYLYLVNDSPWDVSISMQLDLPPNGKLEKLGESRGIGPLVRSAGGTSWKVALRPYDLVAARFSTPNVHVRNPKVSLSDQVIRSLQHKIEDLVARVAALGNPQPISVLENPGFETSSAGDPVPGWTPNAAPGGSVVVDTQQKHSGAQSLKLAGTGQRVSVTSAPFEPPSTGRLAIEVWLRIADPRQQPSVRIGVEGDLRDGKFEPYGNIPPVGAGAASPDDWMRYAFQLDNLPSEGLTALRIQLELLNAGEVWVDDVQVFDLSFSEPERLELSKMISLASVQLEKGQVADCARLLEGYWPQFLVANVPLMNGAQARLIQRPRNARTPAVAPPKKPTVLENLRTYLPRLQR